MTWLQKTFNRILARGVPAARYPIDGIHHTWVGPRIQEPFTGAWQQNAEAYADSVLGYGPVYACVTLAAGDIGKLGLNLVAVDENGIWTPVENPAFSPVLRKPNHYQTRIKFIEQWMTSKLIHGNAYALKQRDARGLVTKLYLIDPQRVTPLVTTAGDVYYEIRPDYLAGLPENTITVPARDIIHDPMVCLFHPLIGVTPIFACGMAALQGLKIQSNSTEFFASGSQPGGILTAPGEINDDQAARLKSYWMENFTGINAGQVAVVGNGVTYEQLGVNAVDAQLIEQLGWTGRTIAGCYHVPAYKIGIGDYPHFNNVEALNQDYYSQCLQSLIESCEVSLDEGLELPKPYHTKFNIDDLLRMDTATKTKAAADGVGSGCLAIDEARKRYFNLGPTPGGNSPYLQVQNYSLAALATRDANDPFAKPEPPPPEPADVDENFVARLFYATHQKAVAGGLYES